MNWLIYRHGSNHANQSMTSVMPLTIAEGASEVEALDAAAEEHSVYSNQHLTAVAEDDADLDPDDWNLAGERDALAAQPA